MVQKKIINVALVFLLFAVSCRKKENYVPPPPPPHYKLDKNFSSFFSKLPDKLIINCRSSDSLYDQVEIIKSGITVNDCGQGNYCYNKDEYIFESVACQYTRKFYPYSVTLTLEQRPQGTYFTISAHGDIIRLCLNDSSIFMTDRWDQCGLWDYHPTISIVSVTAYGKTYSPVFKIKDDWTFTITGGYYDSDQGKDKPTNICYYYISPEYGLLKIVEKEKREWEFDVPK